jgi:dTDP-4-dehydrorhamnose reductase
MLEKHGENTAGLARRKFDVADAAAIATALNRHRPRSWLTAPPWTLFDDAETNESAASEVNGVLWPSGCVRGTRHHAGAAVHRLRIRQ